MGASCRDKSITKEHDGECQPEKAQMAAQHDEEISKSLKSKHGLEDHPIKAQGSRLGVATFVSICVVGALAYAVYHVRQRRSNNPATLPRYDFSVNEFRDVDLPSQVSRTMILAVQTVLWPLFLHLPLESAILIL